MSNAIEIVRYSVEWPRQFEAERDRIAVALGVLALRIDHNGSTSVPGLAAKPVIDIQISVEHLDPIATYSAPLQRIGYVHVPHADDAFCPFFHRPRHWPHTHHVHVVQAGGTEEHRTLAFRDYLREHASVAREYELLKRGLASQYNAGQYASREGYADAKSEFIENVIARALAAGYPLELRATVRQG